MSAPTPGRAMRFSACACSAVGQSNRVIANCKDCPHPPFQLILPHEHLRPGEYSRPGCCAVLPPKHAVTLFQSIGLTLTAIRRSGAGQPGPTSPWRALWGRWRGERVGPRGRLINIATGSPRTDRLTGRPESPLRGMYGGDTVSNSADEPPPRPTRSHAIDPKALATVTRTSLSRHLPANRRRCLGPCSESTVTPCFGGNTAQHPGRLDF